MRTAHLGELSVSRIGLGAMSMSGSYGAPDEAESIRTIHRALELGVTLLDTAEAYGPFHNEELIGRAIKGRRDQVVLATKFGFISHTGREAGRLAAGVVAEGDDIVPIPGTKHVSRVEENVAADDVRLTGEQLAKLTRVSPPAGEHHNEAQMRMLDR